MRGQNEFTRVWVEAGRLHSLLRVHPEDEDVEDQLEIRRAWSLPPGHPTVMTGTPFSAMR
jgi:hypothetical protein